MSSDTDLLPLVLRDLRPSGPDWNLHTPSALFVSAFLGLQLADSELGDFSASIIT